MGTNIMCVTASGGLPIFSRKMGHVEPLSFSTIGSLNGVHMFGKSHGVTILNCQTDRSTVIWKEFENSVVLIAISTLNDEPVLTDMIDIVFNAMVLAVGINEIKTIKNAERLKRDLRVIYPVLDGILECLDYGDRNISKSSNILNFIETMPCPEHEVLRICLEAFVENIGSEFGCLTIENCVVAATEGWWSLASVERKLISHVLASNSNCTAIDTPVYLPCRSPSVPFRLCSVCLISSVWVTVLCGMSPDLATVEQVSYQCWSSMLNTLRSALLIHPRNLPPNAQVHDSIIGFMLMKNSVKKYVSCVHLNPSKKENKSCGEILKTFYYHAASLLFRTAEGLYQPSETYWAAEYHKLHALKEGDNMVCIMFHSFVPTHTMRLISGETLRMLTSQCIFEW